MRIVMSQVSLPVRILADAVCENNTGSHKSAHVIICNILLHIKFRVLQLVIQSTLVISISLIWNYRLSRSENLTTGNKILWKRGAPFFHNIFNISLTPGVKLRIHL